MKFARFLSGLLMAIGLSTAAATPAAAQFASKGHEFLETVRKSEGKEMMEMLATSNNQLVTARDISTNDTALHIVTRRRDLTYLKYITQKGADVNASNDAGETPLTIAVDQGWLEGVEYLLFRKARVDATNSIGETPLIQAVHRRSTELIAMLMEAGADPDRNDNSGRSARDYAMLDSRNSRVLAAIEDNEQEKSAAGSYGPGA